MADGPAKCEKRGEGGENQRVMQTEKREKKKRDADSLAACRKQKQQKVRYQRQNIGAEILSLELDSKSVTDYLLDAQSMEV